MHASWRRLSCAQAGETSVGFELAGRAAAAAALAAVGPLPLDHAVNARMPAPQPASASSVSGYGG